MSEAAGFIEVFGLTAAFVAADAACKAGNVTIEAFDNNKPLNADKLPVPLIMLIKVRGSIEDVRMAIDAADKAATAMTGVVVKHIIPRPDKETEKLIKINCLK